MHFHIVHGPTWAVLLAFTAVGLWLGAFESVRLLQMLDARSLPVAQGQVLQRREISRWGMPLARLTIREAARGDTVFAVTHNHFANRLTGTVQFRYSGDPRNEVRLEGEDNPLWLLLLAWGLPLLLWLVYFGLRRSPRWRSMVP